MSEDISVVDFTGIRFLPTRIVIYLIIYDLIPGTIDLCDHVSFIFLNMVSIIKYIARRTIYCFAYEISLWGGSQEKVRGIAQRLQNHHKTMRFKYFCRSFEGFYHIGCLDIHGEPSCKISWNNGHPFCIDTLGYFDRTDRKSTRLNSSQVAISYAV